MDGSPLFTSSKSSTWPIQFTLHELAPHLRFATSTLGGLWFGKKQPQMALFFYKFVKQFEDVPLEWSHGTMIYSSMMYAICCCVDAPAHAVVQN